MDNMLSTSSDAYLGTGPSTNIDNNKLFSLMLRGQILSPPTKRKVLSVVDLPTLLPLDCGPYLSNLPPHSFALLAVLLVMPSFGISIAFCNPSIYWIYISVSTPNPNAAVTVGRFVTVSQRLWLSPLIFVFEGELHHLYDGEDKYQSPFLQKLWSLLQPAILSAKGRALSLAIYPSERNEVSNYRFGEKQLDFHRHPGAGYDLNGVAKNYVLRSTGGY
ncbi:hypothetical protein IW261DRAFT_1415504 [Armillaria novae-zelandiae]|uniref:Uncharacterized protein n=1 Tax=Armillaria novae-zelandiae TaxID=153914 RepID=A0AA39PPZ8_9AGAR|nr:hypothetical protein IW261DRAFT_1415504 [Armillaria novae-zelandiae]